MSVKYELERISSEVLLQRDLIMQIQETMRNNGVIAGYLYKYGDAKYGSIKYGQKKPFVGTPIEKNGVELFEILMAID